MKERDAAAVDAAVANSTVTVEERTRFGNSFVVISQELPAGVSPADADEDIASPTYRGRTMLEWVAEDVDHESWSSADWESFVVQARELAENGKAGQTREYLRVMGADVD